MKTKEPKEEITLEKCICGAEPLIVKWRGKKMACCPDSMNCALRSAWCSKEQEAIKSFNTAVDEARYKRRITA